MNDQVGSSALVILDEKQERILFERAAARKCVYDPEKKQRNNEQELGAIIRTLMSVPEGSQLLIHSDSQYAVKVLSGDWEAKANLGLVDRFHQEKRKRRLRVELRWVRGHNGNPMNERADQLCAMAANSVRKGGPAVFQSERNLCFE
ncbi:MAG: hypothetical protein IK114_14135 [Fibrobacter sp.]|nr:hypothetical protein [Fibrobacter sp.]